MIRTNAPNVMYPTRAPTPAAPAAPAPAAPMARPGAARGMPQRPPMTPMTMQNRPRPPRPVSPRAPAAPMAGVAGMSGLMSDEKSKEEIARLKGELSATYRALGGPAATAGVNPQPPPREALDEAYTRAGGYTYQYKDPSMPGAGEGRFAGPMAQELEGIPGVVRETPHGKQVDPGRLTLANTSEIGQLRREVDALSGGSDARLSQELAAGEQRALDQIRGGGGLGALTDRDARLARELAEGEQRALSQIRGR